MDTPLDPFFRFKAELVKTICQTINELRADGGTASMSARNLFQVVHPPKGGPQGVNAGYVYRQMFQQALAALPRPYRGFVADHASPGHY